MRKITEWHVEWYDDRTERWDVFVFSRRREAYRFADKVFDLLKETNNYAMPVSVTRVTDGQT